MKIGWGRGIAIFYLSFMAAIIAVVIYATGFNENLQVENYYLEEQNYNAKLEQINNAKKLEEKPFVVLRDNFLEIRFGSLKVDDGAVMLFRPSDNKMDQSFKLVLDSANNQKIDITDKKKGNWQVQLSWIMQDKEYFIEKKMIF